MIISIFIRGAQDRSTCGREAVKSVSRLFDELVKCDEEGVLKEVRSAVEGMEYSVRTSVLFSSPAPYSNYDAP